jgi:hypothetical protein
MKRFGGRRDRDNAEADAPEPQAEEAGGDTQPTESDEQRVDGLIRQAYLRTLSRNPEEHELQLAREYVSDAGDTINGLRGVLWALVNTKEFIVNH